MGRSAKFYKKPTLKEKQATKKMSSSASASAAMAEKARQEARAAALREEALRLKQRQQQDQEHEREEGCAGGRSKAAAGPSRLKIRAQKKGSLDAGGYRTPKEAGIDYVRQWEGKRG
ncbi:hypothetical protein K437DRAFT_273699 [Tilletiaria anomala UBC 951]|uniref:Uncharacterized protein n=1 Tax=Tilletiaria anomala (strain ATCC 24038 / CBS 436.72 / UBC 951) TaxID=1037660 RepID=A0A066W8H8_TILAU|nr:uncharacterized protein K437DRAFT_273699 [Tilletiaria anomala UBC 951]KDN47349.1 hypothetical protein K437DRAFT_273699 [Tilletiaria anomala UBC 951]